MNPLLGTPSWARFASQYAWIITLPAASKHSRQVPGESSITLFKTSFVALPGRDVCSDGRPGLYILRMLPRGMDMGMSAVCQVLAGRAGWMDEGLASKRGCLQRIMVDIHRFTARGLHGWTVTNMSTRRRRVSVVSPLHFSRDWLG